MKEQTTEDSSWLLQHLSPCHWLWISVSILQPHLKALIHYGLLHKTDCSSWMCSLAMLHTSGYLDCPLMMIMNRWFQNFLIYTNAHLIEESRDEA